MGLNPEGTELGGLNRLACEIRRSEGWVFSFLFSFIFPRRRLVASPLPNLLCRNSDSCNCQLRMSGPVMELSHEFSVDAVLALLLSILTRSGHQMNGF